MMAVGDDDKGMDSGSEYLFRQDMNGQYQQTKKMVASQALRLVGLVLRWQKLLTL